MKLDIENKILIPFMILIILSITSLGAVSYWNGYRLLTDNQKKNMTENLVETIHYIEALNKEVQNQKLSVDNAKSKALNYYEGLNQAGLVVWEGNNLLLNRFELNYPMNDIQSDISIDIIENDNTVFTYTYFSPWDWTIGYGLTKNIFSEELVAIQKYNLLIVIVSLIISMQATILIAYNLSKPIRSLADTCNRIAQGNFEEKIFIRRTDEIGVLANAFNNMMSKLHKNTSKLIEIKQFNEDILRNVSTGIVTIDREGNMISSNHTAEKMLQYNILLQGSNQSLQDVIIHQLTETIRTEKRINHIFSFNHQQNNDVLYMDVTTSLLKTEEDHISGAICNFNNITERKKIEKKIERVNRLTSVGQLAAGLAHEIRNPLAGMKTAMQVLRNRMAITESNGNLFNGVLYEIDRLNNLITDMLNFAKPHIPKYESASVLKILKRSLYLTNKAASEKQIKIKVVDKAAKHMIIVDQGQIEQIFLNIITNALMAMDQHGVLTITIKNISTKLGSFVSIEFNDNGCGISQEDIEKVFDPFYTTYPQGTGLGLSVVHKLVIENNGEIEVESKIAVGTKFKVRFRVEG